MNKQALDNYITGHYGEDQFNDSPVDDTPVLISGGIGKHYHRIIDNGGKHWTTAACGYNSQIFFTYVFPLNRLLEQDIIVWRNSATGEVSLSPRNADKDDSWIPDNTPPSYTPCRRCYPWAYQEYELP